MACDLPLDLEFAIWDYLEDEERALLERWFQGKSFRRERKNEKKSSMTIQRMAGFSARTGWIDALDTMKTFINLNTCFRVAAGACQIRTMAQLEQWGATDYKGALRAAAEEGQIEAMHYVRPHVEKKALDDAVEGAAAEHQDAAIMSLFDWGATNLSGAMFWAANSGSIPTMDLVRSLGDLESMEISTAMLAAAESGSIEAVKHIAKMDGFGIPFDIILMHGAIAYDIKMMQWAKDNGAANFEDAISYAIECDRHGMIRLLKRWITERNG